MMAVRIEGREYVVDDRRYITSTEYARRYKRDAAGLRAAANAGRFNLADEAIDLNGRTRLYPLDRITEWRAEADARSWARTGAPKGDVIKIAERYDLERTMVYRALKNGHLRGVKDDAGLWRISDAAAAAWAAEWLGITEPVRAET